ncbi:MAG: glycosyl hydrolase [Desulfobacterales bacterium]|nr:glycoside hydrolase family 88 protein [Deltaproteobacteria bacterium]NNK94279.1 glycosyl hydrolase [Desulfobacterales bacterium]
MLIIDTEISPSQLDNKLNTLFELAAQKIVALENSWDVSLGTPVFTIKGTYTSRGWTEWTQGFQFGCAILLFDATDEAKFLEYGRNSTIRHMAPHISHIGVHDHGFNNVSTYGNLLRLMHEQRIAENQREREFYELALKLSGAIQAARWTDIPDGLGYIYSFNGPHSLFADTIRTVRTLILSHQLGHVLMGEQDESINLLRRALQHAETTARYNVFFGKKRDAYDIRGRVAHEAVFNIHNGQFRCPNTQQGYSPYTTWTRGLSWIFLGFAELLEYIDTLEENSFASLVPEFYAEKKAVLERFLDVIEAVADFYIEHSTTDGIPFWDTGAPGIALMTNSLDRPADPYNGFEPIDTSAAAICAQGFLRIGSYLAANGDERKGERYFQAGLTIANTLLSEPHLSIDPAHQGLLLHSIYHRPNGWDYIPPGQKVPCGESCMWGDYHLMELGVYLQRLAQNGVYHKFYLAA